MGGNRDEPLSQSSQPGTARFALEYTRINHVDYLNYDERFNFVLDLEANGAGSNSFIPLAFCNAALLNSAKYHRLVLHTFSPTSDERSHEESAFAEWVLHQSTSTGFQTSKVFFQALWTVTTIPNNWAVICGVEISRCEFNGLNINSVPIKTSQHQNDLVERPRSRAYLKKEMDVDPTSIEHSQPSEKSSTMWPPSKVGDSDHIKWIRDFDWASTSLGPTNTWPPRLKQACETMLADTDPATIFWGPDLILIYNEPYLALAGNKHPSMMGASARVHWKEVWDQYDPLFLQMIVDGKAFKQDNVQLFLHRRGFLEEGFFNLRIIPLFDDSGSVVGFYEPVSEMTKQTLSERRMHTLMELSERTSSTTSLRNFWGTLLQALREHPSDIHFAILYHLKSESTSSPNLEYDLDGTVGFDLDSSVFRRSFGINDDLNEAGFMEAIRKAHSSGVPVLLSSSDGSLSPSMLGKIQTASTADAPTTCIVYPLSSSVDDSVEAFLIFGINPRRPYDEDYELFVNLLARQVESTITFVKLFEKEKERLIQQAVFESELKFKKFAENAQVGIFSFDPAGNITFCNESWLELSGHPRDDMSAMSWTQDVHPENIEDIKAYWDKIVNLEGPQTFEVQYRKPWKPKNLNDDSISLDRTWVVASAYAETNEEGELSAILGCITDISHWKWVDQLQSQRLSEALELKRQQENFLDITSHEMRNPLNAILHCAVELIELLTGLAASSNDGAADLQACIDASRTIVYCGRHQKRIIDDVLTLSKLDSNLLSISPVETRPLDIVEEVLKVFDTEIRASSIQAKAELTDSYKALMIETVFIDPHRVIQILINLTANAIKFTKGESLRNLHIAISAYKTEPASSDGGVRYVPSGRQPADPTMHVEWGTGETLFLHFSVQDTGPGMTREEADLLFNRFAQASPRTHVQYGGSGLGLFISRELAELHGGRIGISSEPGYGSTFDFYIKGRRPVKERTATAPSRAIGDASPAYSRGTDGRGARVPQTPMSQSPDFLRNISQEPPGISDLHVLIVEDNLINQKILTKLIRKHGYAVSIANHGQEALDIIQASAWNKSKSPSDSATLTVLDIVLADIEMPIMDGKEFVRRVRQLQSGGRLTGDIPVIAVTGNARNELVQHAKECGFDEVVSKPYRAEDIISTIKKYTGVVGKSENHTAALS